jgi:hypothetical protein
MADYPLGAGDPITEEERLYYRSVSPDTIQLQEDMRHYLKILVTTLGAAAVTAAIANYSTNKGGTRKRSARRSSRRAYKKKRSTRRR